METRSSVEERCRLQIIEAHTDRVQFDETIPTKTMPDLDTIKQARSMMILKATPGREAFAQV
jgi:hypothetical protein